MLILTTDQSYTPFVSTPYRGLYALTDLVSAGLTFDVRTYSRFVTLDLSPHDVIILNGHTSPVRVEQVAQRCERAMAAGKKIFINGYLPYGCYDTPRTDYIYVDDGAKVDAGSGQIGAKVSLSAPHVLEVGSCEPATGIGALGTDGPEFRRFFRSRRNSDVIVFLP